MKKSLLSLGAVTAALLSFSFLFGCSPPVLPMGDPGESAVSAEELLANLDALGAVKGKALFSASSIPKTTGVPFTPDELAAYLDAISGTMKAYIESIVPGGLHLVMPVKLYSEGQSGLMWVPVSLDRSFCAPIISFQHGTQVFWECAPSRFNPNPLAVLGSHDVAGAFQNYVECVVGALMASAGYIVVMPDYPGFGANRDPHPYVHISLGESARKIFMRARNVLKRLPASARFNGRTYLMGYSEGGFATMAAARVFQKTNIPVTAAVPCAGSYDLSGTMLDEVLAGTPALVPYYIPYTVFGYASVYGDEDPEDWGYDDLLNPPLPAYLDQLFSGDYSGGEIAAALAPFGSLPLAMITPSLAAKLAAGEGTVYRKLYANTLFHSWTPEMPLQMIHCPVDDIVPVENAYAAYAAWQGLPTVLPPILVPPLPLPPELSTLGNVHLFAFPTAMMAGFGFIHGMESALP